MRMNELIVSISRKSIPTYFIFGLSLFFFTHYFLLFDIINGFSFTLFRMTHRYDYLNAITICFNLFHFPILVWNSHCLKWHAKFWRIVCMRLWIFSRFIVGSSFAMHLFLENECIKTVAIYRVFKLEPALVMK